MTNADRIRNYTDEQLACELGSAYLENCSNCELFDVCQSMRLNKEISCYNKWLKYLKADEKTTIFDLFPKK